MRALALVMKWAILLPILLAVLLLSVANDQPTAVHLNPFNPSDPVMTARLPLYQVGFILFVAGALVGAAVALAGRRAAAVPERPARPGSPAGSANPMPQPRSAGTGLAPSETPAALAAYLPRPERS